MEPFIYALVDPAEPRHVRYVGMAKRSPSRPDAHGKLARRKSTRASYLYNWIRKLQAKGREPHVLILEQLAEGASTKLLGFVESCYITSLRDMGHRLTNVAAGGEGGTTLSGEARSAISKKMWDSRPDLHREARERARVLNAQGRIGFKEGVLTWKGRHHSNETKEAISCANIAHWTPEERELASVRTLEHDAAHPERRLKIKAARAAQVMLPRSEKTRRKIGESWTDERRASNSNIGRVRSQEERDRISKSRMGWSPSEETLANMRAAAQQREASKRGALTNCKKETRI
jgi:NUMOD3 motif